MFGFAMSGRIAGLHGIMPWYVKIPEEQWGVDPTSKEVIRQKFEEPHGDLRQEIVFIGTNLKTAAIKEVLDSCLLTKKELKHYNYYNDNGYPVPDKGKK